MNVIAFDPGKATGLACYTVFDTDGDFESMQLDGGWAGQVDRLAENIGDYPWDHVICESFTVNAGTAKKDPSAYPDVFSLIGTIRYLAWANGAEFHFQTPAEAKSFATNDKLRKLGWYKGAPGHADDASRHLLTFLAKNNYRPILERLTAP
mgnify:CR=1 FL=1